MKTNLLHFLLLLPWIVSAQLQKQVTFSQLSVDEGLSQNSVVSIAQDTTGYLWFATQDGLNKYDGKTFSIYPKLYEDITRESYSRLGKIYASPTGALYSISLEGLEAYDQETKRFIKLPFAKKASALLEDHLQQLWITTYGNGLYVTREKDTLQVLRNTDAVSDTYAITHFNDSIVVAGSSEVYAIHPKTLAYKKLASSNVKNSNYSSLASTKDQTLWVGSFGNGLFFKSSSQSKLQKFSGFSQSTSLPISLNIQCLWIDSKNRLWIGTYGDGAYLIDFEQEQIEHFTPKPYDPQAIHYKDVISIFEDYTGVIWLGTDGGGLSYYDENLTKFSSMTNAQVPEFANVAVARAITMDREGTVWVGTSGNGLTSYTAESKKFNTYKKDLTAPYNIPSNRVMSLLSVENELWMGFQDEGLAIIKDKSVIPFNASTTPELLATTIWCMYKDTKERIWLGTREFGIIQFSPELGVVRQYSKDSTALLSNTIRVIEEDTHGALWIGTQEHGLAKLLPETGDVISFQKKGIEKIKSLYFNSPFLWIGTNGNGLHAFNVTTEQLFSFTSEQGLPNNVIYGILPDAQDNLWLSSNRGITRFSIDDITNNPNLTNYTTKDGLQAMEFNTGASYKAQDGTLYFGGLDGVNWFQPEALSGNPTPPRTVITQMQVFNEDVPLEQNHKFPFKENTLSFSFAGLHFSQPESNRYKYILSNYENEWSLPSTNNYAHYPNLPAGEYTFQVLSSNYEDIWDATPALYNFTIKPLWYLSNLAKVMYAILSILLLWGTYQYLKWNWKMKLRLEMEHEETERLKQLDELKSKLYTNISHEFRTPLTLISAPVQQLISSSHLAEKDKKSLHIIQGSSQRMLRLVNQLLDLSKLEKGAVTLQVTQNQLKPQLLQLIEAFVMKANERGITIDATIDTFEDSWYDKDVMEKIVSNLLSNSVKYAPENSKIVFSAKKKNGFVTLKTTNDNDSLSEKQIHTLFERFFQTSKYNEGVGVGLALIKELTQLSHGSVLAKKETPSSISFEVRIPIEKDQYNSNSIQEKNIEFKPIQPEVESIFISDNDEKPQLLIVEDNAEIRSYMASLFSEIAEVREAKDGLQGIKYAIEAVPDIIISDIMMPKKNGIELCNTLKNDVRTSHIPILLLTAKSGDTNELEGLKNKADDYLIKPFNAEVLYQKIVNTLHARRELKKRYSQNVFLAPKEIAITSMDEVFLENIQQILDEELRQSTFNTEVFAKALHMSRMQLHRKLKALTGLTTTEFIRSQRLKSAIQLLNDSDLTINEIAYTVGFNTPSYFIKCFKETYGKTPAEFANN